MRLARHLTIAATEIEEMERLRPRTRGDCVDGPRPCPWHACRHHLGTDVHNGELRLREIEDGQESCALDVAGRGEHTALETADATGLWHTDVEKTIGGAMKRLRGKLNG